ncbi:MAG: hypothetical protein IK990_00805 [Ruminiclostridium sp.]|nr:hypothetical protein [Ruminococcus sp.]MBP3854136.1 hypothetical protein [Ruminiclostridium sp.]
MTDIEKLRRYVDNGSQTNDTFMYVERDGIKYVYMPTYETINIYEDYLRKAGLIGLIVGGVFYSTDYRFKDVEKDLWEEVASFRVVYDKMYEEKKAVFSVDNPVPITNAAGEYDPVKEQLDLDHYADRQLKRDARTMFFFNSVPGEYGKFNSEYTEPFLKYLVYGEEYMTQYIKDVILSNAVNINYRLRVRKMLDDEVQKMRRDSDMILRKALYDRLVEKDGATYKATVLNSAFPPVVISITLSELGYMITEPGRTLNIYSIPKADRSKIGGYGEIRLENISKITYGRTVLYEKEKGVL